MNFEVVNMSEAKVIGKLESYYLEHKRGNLHISLEDLDDTEWFWSLSEVERFDKLWKQRITLKDIAKELKRSETAVFLQALDRIDKGKVRPRHWNIW